MRACRGVPDALTREHGLANLLNSDGETPRAGLAYVGTQHSEQIQRFLIGPVCAQFLTVGSRHVSGAPILPGDNQEGQGCAQSDVDEFLQGYGISCSVAGFHVPTPGRSFFITFRHRDVLPADLHATWRKALGYDADQNLNAWMHWAQQVIPVIHVVDVNFGGVVPATGRGSMNPNQ